MGKLVIYSQFLRNWDGPIVKGHFNSLLSAADTRGKAHLLAGQQKEAGAWLSAPPTSSLGLCMENSTIQVAVGLSLGAPHSRHSRAPWPLSPGWKTSRWPHYSPLG